MDGNKKKSSDSQFISFQDFPSINHGGNIGQAQLNINASSTHQGFHNCRNWESKGAQVGLETTRDSGAVSREHSPLNHEALSYLPVMSVAPNVVLGMEAPNLHNLPNDTTGIGIIEDLQGMPDKNEAPAQRSFWTIEYYQKYFNVNTNDVVERVKRSMLPKGSENYLISHIRPNPDLYGPFWICVTLIFAIAISGNMANYLQTANSSKYHWRYEFHIVSYAATCIFLYAWLLPLLLWGALKWTTVTRSTEEELIESHATPGLLELICLYGYSLAIYIPVAFLLVIQVGWLQWSLIVIATFLSGGVLLRSLLPVIRGKYGIVYIAVILGMHLLLAAGFMLYFFHGSSNAVSTNIMEHVATTVRVEEIGSHAARANTSG